MTKHYSFLLRRWLDLDMFLSLFWQVKKKFMIFHEIRKLSIFNFDGNFLKNFVKWIYWRNVDEVVNESALFTFNYFFQFFFLLILSEFRILQKQKRKREKKQEIREKKKMNEIIFSFSINSG